MPETMSLNVRVSGSLRDYVTQATTSGDYENVSEYVRDLIRRDKDRAEAVRLEALRAELQQAFATPDEDYVEVSADHIRRKAAQRRPA